MRKKSHDKILKWESKEQHLSTIFKSCPIFIISLTFQNNNFSLFQLPLTKTQINKNLGE